MLRFDKMTVKAQEALQESQEIAARHEQQEIAPLHLLSALVAQADGVVPSLLTRLGVRTEALAGEIERELGRLPKVQGFSQQTMGRALNDVLEQAVKEADRFKDEYVSTEHMFLAIAGKDRHRGRPRAAHRIRRRSGRIEDQAACRARSRRACCRGKIPR